MEAKQLLEFLHVMEKMKCNTRHCDTSTGRRESVAEHSWRLCMMAYLLREEFPGLDMDKVIQMCLVHDIGEAVTGDIPAFEKTDRHEAAEGDALQGLLGMLPDPQRGRLAALFAEMEARQTGEARLYKILDRLEALIQHDESDLSTWLPVEFDLQFTYGSEECRAFPYTARLREAVDALTRERIASYRAAEEGKPEIRTESCEPELRPGSFGPESGKPEPQPECCGRQKPDGGKPEIS